MVLPSLFQQHLKATVVVEIRNSRTGAELSGRVEVDHAFHGLAAMRDTPVEKRVGNRKRHLLIDTGEDFDLPFAETQSKSVLQTSACTNAPRARRHVANLGGPVHDQRANRRVARPVVVPVRRQFDVVQLHRLTQLVRHRDGYEYVRRLLEKHVVHQRLLAARKRIRLRDLRVPPRRLKRENDLLFRHPGESRPPVRAAHCLCRGKTAEIDCLPLGRELVSANGKPCTPSSGSSVRAERLRIATAARDGSSFPGGADLSSGNAGRTERSSSVATSTSASSTGAMPVPAEAARSTSRYVPAGRPLHRGASETA